MPPFAVISAEPVFAPKQPTLVCVLRLELRAAAGCVMVTICVVVQPRASVTVQVQGPAGKLFAVAVVCTGAVFQLYP